MVGGWDPSGSVIGHAMLDTTPGPTPDEPPALLALDALRVAKTKDGDTRFELVMGEVQRMAGRYSVGDAWAIEVMPKKLKASQHASHYSAAPVAWWGGVLYGMGYARQLEPVPMTIGTWRGAMLHASRKWGLPLARPQARNGAIMPTNRVLSMVRLSGGLQRLTRQCGHVHEVASSYLLGNGAPSCPQCHRAQASKTSAQAQRDAWKATAVAFVDHFWPGQLAPLVERARGRARAKDKAAHELVGVADACEAVGIACGVWTP